MSEREAKQKRRRRAKLIRDVLDLTPEAYDESNANKIITAILALSDAQFAQLSLRLAKQLMQSPMKDVEWMRGIR